MKHRVLGAVCALAILCLAPACLRAQQSSPHPSATPHATAAGSGTPWWKNAVIYEVYPRSFQDSNGDGVGDLNGITERLGYLQSLGVNAIWLTPIYDSPQVDFGYDISNYYHIDPRYGTMADFDRLVREARKHHIGVIMDLVLNHTSDKHPWFLESESSRTNPKRDWYIWRNGRKGPDGTLLPPNNWQSDFGGSAWQYDPKTRQFYYHKFYIQQPDLNWNNPQVRKAMYDVARFWIRHGVAGFRLDAITTLFEDPELRNEKPILGPDGKPKIDAFGEVELDDSLTNNLPQVHDVLRQLRQVADSYHRNILLIGETYLSSIKDLRAMYGANNDELQLPMDMQVGFINKLDVKEFRARINEAETKLDGDEPLFVFDNHDNVRWERYANAAGVTDPVERQNIARLLAAILFASRDSALMYYGDEIGMVTTPPKTKAEVRDPVGLRGWPKNKGRDGERTPMQWNGGVNAGFTQAKPWLPIPASYRTHNVAAETQDPASILNFYKALLRLRRQNPALLDGDYTDIAPDDPNLLCFVRQQGARSVAVLLNLSGTPQPLHLDLKRYGPASRRTVTLLSTMNVPAVDLEHGTLDPYGVLIVQMGQ